MFIQLPDSFFKPTGLANISGGSLTASVVEAKVAKIASVTDPWMWEAIPREDDAFLVSFPSVEVLQDVSAFEFRVTSHDVTIAISEWKANEVPQILPLQPVWVHVAGVPPPFRHFLGLWAVGSVIGTTQDVDLVCLRRGGIVRIQVAVLTKNIFMKHDGIDGASVSPGVFVNLNGYEFRYVLEEDDYVPDDDFIPRIWDHHDDGPDNGANRDADIPDRDASKRAKNDAKGTSSSSANPVDTPVPMQINSLVTAYDTVPVQTILQVHDLSAQKQSSQPVSPPVPAARLVLRSQWFLWVRLRVA